MKQFARLVQKIDETTKTNVKINALVDFFHTAPDQDKVWCIALFTHRRPKRPLTTTLLREWAAETSNIPLWLFEESYHIVGDLAETISLLSPHSDESENDQRSLSDVIREIIALKEDSEENKKSYIVENWKKLSYYECFIFNKILTGGFRIGISQKNVIKALSKAFEIDENIVAHKLMGNWNPSEVSFNELILTENEQDDDSRPYPFYLAYQLENLDDLGLASEWLAERKWDGIRGQIIVRNRAVYVWSRGEELVTDKYPEFQDLGSILPHGTVLDGEILPFKEGRPLSFHALQTRIGRKTVGKSLLEKTPVILMVYDLLEYQGEDIRNKTQAERRQLLEKLMSGLKENEVLRLSDLISFDSWESLALERNESRAHLCEGLMLKRKTAPYQVGRKKGDWWKWKVDPLTVDAVLTYAMRGHGRRSNLFTDYTFGLWDNGELVTFAKAYSGLTDEDFKKVDRFVKKNTIAKFGPVRQVKPELVFEIAFEGVAFSSRHKSGVAVRFPRMKKWRVDKKVSEADSLEHLKNMIEN
ncbi:MAG: ATP-dependent DNA ligase [Flavobacteriales bacterium]|nr:ATP-dependent DNA ligase [Flavobacteriales bacterium]